jgi:hypothetical protein
MIIYSNIPRLVLNVVDIQKLEMDGGAFQE